MTVDAEKIVELWAVREASRKRRDDTSAALDRLDRAFADADWQWRNAKYGKPKIEEVDEFDNQEL